MKKLKPEQLRNHINHINALLASEIPQSAKKTLCSLAEGLLMDTDTYSGFNNVYWMQEGCDNWYQCSKPDFPEKIEYIIGHEGSKNRDNDDFISDTQGEYARHYHTGNIF